MVHPLDVACPMCSIESEKNNKYVLTFLDIHICKPLLVIVWSFWFWLELVSVFHYPSYYFCELKDRTICAAQILMCQLLISNGVPTSHTCTSIMPFSLSPYSFYSFVMSDIKLMVSFGFTITHVSLKSSLISSSVEQNIATDAQKRTPWDHMYHIILTLFTEVPYIGIAGSSCW